MPPRKTYKKSRPARKVRKAVGRRRGGDKIVHLPGTLAPQHLLTQLKYVATYQKGLVPSKVTNFNQWRLNSIYDPDYTSLTGTSCLGLTQWAALYQRYRVYKCDYSVRLTNLSSDTMVSGALCFNNYVDTSFSVSDYMRPLCRRWEVGNKEGNNRTVLKGTMYLPKLAGMTPTQYKTSDINSIGFGASPINPLIMSLLAESSNGGVTAVLGVQVDLTYHVEMIATQSGSEAVDRATGLPVVPEAHYAS